MPDRSRTEPGWLAAAGSRTEPRRQLNDSQWFLIEDLFPDPPPNPKGGRPPCPNRDCFEGILFVLQTGCRWKDLPKCFPLEMSVQKGSTRAGKCALKMDPP